MAARASGASGRVGECRPVAADAAVMEVQGAVVHAQRVGDEFLAVAIVAGDDAGNGLGPGMAVADADTDAIADAQPLAAAGVVDVDDDLAHGHEFARLPRPGEVTDRVAAAAAGEDLLQ